MIGFALPKDLIAQVPARPRDTARLLVYDRKSKKITDAVFKDLPSYLTQDTTIVVNNSKVEHCRWLFDGGKIEILVLDKLDSHTIRALVRPGKRFKLGNSLQITDWLTVNVAGVDVEGIRTLKLNIAHDDDRLHAVEHVPLPPYIKQDDKLAREYQTIYAKPLGSKAAPTAGLHFTDELMLKIKQNYAVAEVTLHVGLGTFASLNEENFKSGKLHEENYVIDESNLKIIKSAQHITSVGTTTTRTLESWKKTGMAQDSTSIFIQPGFEFSIVDSMITNFHLPGTSLLLMVEAFVGSEDELLRIYNHAINQKYRFYSFGDAMLIL